MFTFTIPSESISYGYAVFQSKGDLTQLNIEVTGSEGEHVFSVRINKGLLKQHKYRRNKESDEDWEKVVRWVFTGEAGEGFEAESVITQCSYDSMDKSLSVSIRRRKSDGIVARLGDIELKETSTGDPDLMTWVRSIDESRTNVQKTLRETRIQTNMYKGRCVELEKQLQSLIAEKRRYEKELVNKFSALLNTKKRKMRQFEGEFSDGFGDYVKKEEFVIPELAEKVEHLPPFKPNSPAMMVKEEETISEGLLNPDPKEPIELDSDATVESD
ncbi:hypothetical protein B0I75DRAFT_138404 [Yarrowia lipolytica]|nr:Hypothetical protein YALI2_B00160g [Yarrowia lipolytica]RDW26090.1 hypothetical protein B0I71DRAFT_131501 [Yarrowia lipolytica]RDW45393.1 hypothetical protein B0I74DRAFT_138852 [Yarrowia lipolytica]RDW52305.1 hypothetical protein B0I75DRAFT_138404 [Yarrowia lipolytica]SEI34042.1 YALIA101S04e08856g1_1 [Yarrowia lipolytica]